MGLNSRMDLAEKILQVHMELEDAEKEMGMISDRIREFEKISRSSLLTCKKTASSFSFIGT